MERIRDNNEVDDQSYAGNSLHRYNLHLAFPTEDADDVDNGTGCVNGDRANPPNPLAQCPRPARGKIVDGDFDAPSREEVAAELILFIRETVRELGEHRASGFLKKFYGWYLGRGRFPRPFKQELVQLESTEDVVTRLYAAAPGAAEIVERLEAELPDPQDEILLDHMPISIYGGG